MPLNVKWYQATVIVLGARGGGYSGFQVMGRIELIALYFEIWHGIFEVLFEALGIYWDFLFLLPFDHPYHLKYEVPLLRGFGCIPLR